MHYQIQKKGISDKIMSALLIGICIPALITSPFALYAITVGAAKYYFRKHEFNRAVKRLQKHGFVSLVKSERGLKIKLLSKGRVYLYKLNFEKLTLPKPVVWDRKWRLFFFDIPEKYRNERNMIRRKLQTLGCYNIQRSVFIYPHECRKELEMVAGYYKVQKYTLYAEVISIEMERTLKKHFQL